MWLSGEPRCCHYRCVHLWMLVSHYHPVSCIMQADSGNFLNKQAWLSQDRVCECDTSKLLLPGRIKEYFYDIFDWVSLLCPSPIVDYSGCVPFMLCPSPIVYRSRCVPVRLFHSTAVSQSRCVPVKLCLSPVVSPPTGRF